MKLGFVSAILPDLNLREVLSFAGQVGYDCVEVMSWPKGKSTRRYAGITHIDVERFSNAQGKEVKALMDQSGVEISSLGYYPNPLSPNAAERKVAVAQIKKVIKAAHKLGLHTVTTFVGRDWTKSIEGNWSSFKRIWKPIIEYAEKYQVRIGIENCPMWFSSDEWPGGKNLATTPAIWRRMFAEIPSANFGLNYDPSHMIWQHMDYLQPIKDFSDRLHHIHAKDVRLDQDRLNQVGIMAHPNDYHAPKLPGLGDVNWGKFFSYLTDVGYNGPVCVEVEDRAYEGSLEDRKRALKQSYTYLRQYVV
ncbi:MAG: sugar phosphate isomerase/epimerase [Saprospiraceae bacterium]|nr:sugar phosphate isomerase/epimerase [Saprospiraceae bacterium]